MRSCMAGTVWRRSGEETSKISYADLGLSLALLYVIGYSYLNSDVGLGSQ